MLPARGAGSAPARHALIFFESSEQTSLTPVIIPGARASRWYTCVTLFSLKDCLLRYFLDYLVRRDRMFSPAAPASSTFAPRLSGETAVRFKLEEPCDRVLNHALFCGARVGKVNGDGCYEGLNGTVMNAHIVTGIASDKKSRIDVSYEVLYDDGSKGSLKPTQLFQALLFYSDYGNNEGPVPQEERLSTAMHISNLSTLSKNVKLANVIGQPVCRRLSVDTEQGTDGFVIGYVTRFYIKKDMPYWTISYPAYKITEDIGQESLKDARRQFHNIMASNDMCWKIINTKTSTESISGIGTNLVNKS